MADREINFLLLFREQGQRVVESAINAINGASRAVTNLRTTISPLTGMLAGVAAGFLSVAAARRALTAGEQDVQAEQRLAVALKENVHLLEQRKKFAQEVQSTTTFSVQQVLEAEAALRDMGITQSQIDTNLRAVIGRAAQLNTTLLEQANLIGRITITGQAGRLGAQIQELDGLTEAQLKAGKATEILADKYKNVAQQIANTPFGKAKQEANDLDDTFSRFGQLLIRFQTQILPAVNTAFGRLISALESPRGQRGMQMLTDLAVFTVDNAGTIISVLLVLRGLSILESLGVPATAAMSKAAGSLFVSLLGSSTAAAGTALSLKAIAGSIATAAVGATKFVAGLLTSPAAVAAISVGLAELVMRITGAQTSILDTKKILTDLFDRVKDGTISMKDLVGVISTEIGNEAKVIGAFLKGYLYDVPVAFATSLFAYLALQMDKFDARINLQIAKAGNRLSTKIFSDEDVRTVQQRLDLVTKSIESFSITANTAAASSKVKEDIQAIRDKSKAEQEYATNARIHAKEAAGLAAEEDARQQRLIRRQEELTKAQETYNALLDQQAKLMVQSVDVHEADRLKAALAANEQEFAAKRRNLEDYIAEKERLETESQRSEIERLRALIDESVRQRESLTKEITDSGPAARLEMQQRINTALSEENSWLQQIHRLRVQMADVLLGIHTEEHKLTDEQKLQVQLLKEELSVRRLQAGTLTDRLQAERLELQNKQREEIRKALAILSQKELDDLKATQSAETIALVNKQLLDQAEDANTKAGRAREALNIAIERTAHLEAAGSIDIFQAQSRNAAAQDTYNTQIQGTIEKLKALQAQATNPEVREKIGQMILEARKSADDNVKKIAAVALESGKIIENALAGTFRGLIDGTKNARQAFADFFKDVAAGFADLAAKILAKMAIIRVLNLVGAAFGAPGLGSAYGAATGGGGGFNKGGAVGAVLTPGEQVYEPEAASALGSPALQAINRRSVPAGVLSQIASWLVPGSGPDRDSVPAILSSGSFVLTRRAVQHYGAGVLAALAAAPAGMVSSVLRVGGFLRRNAGGDVGDIASSLRQNFIPSIPSIPRTEAGARQAGVGQGGWKTGFMVPMLPADEQTADRIARGGDNALIEWAGRNKSQLRKLLGLS